MSDDGTSTAPVHRSPVQVPLSVDQEILASLKRIEVLLTPAPKARMSDDDRKAHQKQARQGRDD